MKNILLKIFLWIIFIALLILATYASFFVWKLNKIENRINVTKEDHSILDMLKNVAGNKEVELSGKENERINVLLLGVAGEKKPGKNLSDTIMIASINLKNNQVALLSIPRDLYVEMPGGGFQTKINTLYQAGLSKNENDVSKAMEPIKKTIKNITSLEINYWAVVNFDGFEKVIDAIGGVNIMNEKDIYDTRYPGPNYSYETFELKKGFHQLDGKVALKYARMRHDIEGDFGRAKRQQQVLQATKNKIFSTGTFLNVSKLNELLDALGDNVRTNVSTNELGEFLSLARKIDTDNITNVVLDAWKKESLLKVSHVFHGESRAFVLIPRVGNWSEVEDLAQNIFDINEIKKRRAEISKENATVAIIDKSASAVAARRIQNLLKENFEYKNVAGFSSSDRQTEDVSVIYDRTQGGKPFTADELAKKLPAKISYENFPDYQKSAGNFEADLVVVLGKDLAERYNMVEASLEEYTASSDANDYSEFINNQ
jgi:LCP family protein required for cell wall assembly